MSFFKDTNGREWRVRFTEGILTKVEEATEINLAKPSGEGVLAAIENGRIQTRVLWMLCGDQEPQLTTEEFGEAVASGEVFEAAANAMKEAFTNFIQPSLRELPLTLFREEAREQAARAAIAMEAMNGDELHDQVCQSFRVGLKRELKQILTRLENAGGSLASLDSTPTTPPSES